MNTLEKLDRITNRKGYYSWKRFSRKKSYSKKLVVEYLTEAVAEIKALEKDRDARIIDHKETIAHYKSIIETHQNSYNELMGCAGELALFRAMTQYKAKNEVRHVI